MQPDTPMIIAFFLFALAGFFDGTAETLKFHTGAFFHVFKKASKDFWHPDISWLNKYKNRDPSQGARFFQSTKALVALTDGYHLTRLLRNQATILAILVAPTLPHWYQYAAAWVLCYLAYTVGFSLAWDRLFGYTPTK